MKKSQRDRIIWLHKNKPIFNFEDKNDTDLNAILKYVDGILKKEYEAGRRSFAQEVLEDAKNVKPK
jgi:hypothetical protein